MEKSEQLKETDKVESEKVIRRYRVYKKAT
jgi:hypothetical protein